MSSEAPITSPTTKKRRLEENQDKLQDAAANLLAAAAAVAVEVAEGENIVDTQKQRNPAAAALAAVAQNFSNIRALSESQPQNGTAVSVNASQHSTATQPSPLQFGDVPFLLPSSSTQKLQPQHGFNSVVNIQTQEFFNRQYNQLPTITSVPLAAISSLPPSTSAPLPTVSSNGVTNSSMTGKVFAMNAADTATAVETSSTYSIDKEMNNPKVPASNFSKSTSPATSTVSTPPAILAAPAAAMVVPMDEKIYACAVANCLKKYKNPNGLAYHLEHSHGMEKTNKKQDKSATSVATAAGAATVTLVSTPSLHPQSTPLQQSAPHQPQHQHPQSQPLQSELNNGHVVQQSSETLNQSQDKTIGRLMGNPFADFAGSSATAAASAATTWGSDTVKPYICPHHGCGKAFKNKNGLNYHLTKGKAHSGSPA